MHKQVLLAGMMLCFLSACGKSEAAIATSIAATQKAEEFEALAMTATKLAGPSDTPTNTFTPTITSTATQTPTPSDTPLPSSTSTPPEGSAYVPDLVGLTYDEATAILSELGLPWYYVAVVSSDTPMWEVMDQSPRAGALLDLEEMQVKLVISFSADSPPRPQPRSGYFVSDSCRGVTKEGVCYGGSVFWCENTNLLMQDCSFCDGYCGTNDGIKVCFCP
jgi:hypothetical protein